MNILDRFTTVVRAAQKYHVDPAVLWGIYGKETNFGKDVRTNSKGYTGPFQFGPNEAKQYGYPWTNNPNGAQFAQQADAAAHLLSDRIKSTGSVDAGIKSYSGNGYGLKEVLDKAKEDPGGGIDVGSLPGIKQVGEAAGAVTNAAKDVGGVLGDFFTLITSLDFWLRLGEGIAGLILLAMGLKTLTGTSIPLPMGGRV